VSALLLVYAASLAIIAVVCALAVLHPRYEDNLVQRIGMATACLGSVAELVALMAKADRFNAGAVTLAGVAAFAIGTVWKKAKQK
jgi:hypothetical protein